MAWYQIVTSPVRFLGEKAGSALRWRPALAIFLAFAVLATVGQYIVYDKVMSSIPDSITSEKGWSTSRGWALFGFTFTMVASRISEVVLWVVGAGILTCMAILLDGDGEYRKLLELTGYAHMPMLVFAAAFLAASVVYTPKIDYAGLEGVDFAALDKVQKEAKSEQLKKAVTRGIRPFVKVFSSLAVVAAVWMAALFTVALHFAFRLSYAKSAASVALLALLYVLMEWAKGLVAGGGP